MDLHWQIGWVHSLDKRKPKYNYFPPIVIGEVTTEMCQVCTFDTIVLTTLSVDLMLVIEVAYCFFIQNIRKIQIAYKNSYKGLC